MNKFFCYGLTPEDFNKCAPLIKEKAKKMCGLILAIATCLLSSLFIVSLLIPYISKLRPIYFFCAFSMSLFYFFHRKFSKKLGLTELYIVIALCLIDGAVLLLPFPSEKATVFPLLLVILPALITEKHRNMIICITVSVFAYIVFVFNFKDSSIWFWEIYNTVVLSILSIFVHWLLSRERCLGYLSMINNSEIIVQLEYTQKELKYLSENDILSGLRNRRKLFNSISQIEKEEIAAPFGVMMFDIDDFKKYNDTFGHAAGDQCIHFLGTMLLKFEKSNNIQFYRYGGEEFVGLFWCDTEEDLNRIANDIMVAANSLNLDMASITISIGTVICDSSILNYEHWIALADEALYSAKSKGKNCICFWNETLT